MQTQQQYFMSLQQQPPPYQYQKPPQHQQNQQYQGNYGGTTGYWNNSPNTNTEGYRGGRGGERRNNSFWRGGQSNDRTPKRVAYCWTHGLCGHTSNE